MASSMKSSVQLKNAFSRCLVGQQHLNLNFMTAKKRMLSVSSKFYDAVNRYSISGQQQRNLLAQRLFNAAQHQAFQPQWYADSPFHNNNTGSPRLGLTSDFRSHHAMLTLHIWFLHRRLMATSELEESENSNQGKASFHLLVQEELFNTFWHDTQVRIRAAGINELMVNKHLKDAQQLTFMQMTHYDHAHSTYPMHAGDQGKNEKRFEIVCEAVYRHLLGFGSADDADEEGASDVPNELIRRLGAYVEYQFNNIVHGLPDDYFDEGRIAWGSIPDLEVTEEGEEGQRVRREQMRGENNSRAMSGLDFLLKKDSGVGNQKSDWVRVLNNAGEPYYWNTVTGDTSWTCMDDE